MTDGSMVEMPRGEARGGADARGSAPVRTTASAVAEMTTTSPVPDWLDRPARPIPPVFEDA